MEIYTHTLANGIRCIHIRNKSNVVHCALTINAGSRDEMPAEHGVAHLTEHAIFKGTSLRKAHHINNRLERLGGELNAFTTKEETVVHTTTLKADAGRAAELISDIVFNSTFPPKELLREKEVIYDEINSYRDSPAEQIFDDFEDMIFAGSSIGHNILGTKQTVKKMGRDSILSFTARTYNTDQMVFASVGNISQKNFISIVERNFGGVNPNPRVFERIAPPALDTFDTTVKRNTFQAHCIIGNRAYNLHDTKRLALSLLVNILGGPSANSILNTSVREKYGLTYNIEASYTPMNDTGIASIYFGTDKDNTERCLELVNRELRKLKTERLTVRRLSMAKKQFIGQMSIALDNNEAHMLGAGKSFLVYDTVDDVHAIARKVMAVTDSEIIEVANEIFTDTSMLIYR